MLVRSPKPRPADSTSATVASSLTLRTSSNGRTAGFQPVNASSTLVVRSKLRMSSSGQDATLPWLRRRFDSGHPLHDVLLPRDEDSALRTRTDWFESNQEYHFHDGPGGEAQSCNLCIARFDSAVVVHGRVVITGARPVCTRQAGVRFPSRPPFYFDSPRDCGHWPPKPVVAGSSPAESTMHLNSG